MAEQIEYWIITVGVDFFPWSLSHRLELPTKTQPILV